uniref:Pentacotripeptide-repeat region of PRORP domain-containing protein n=1 Tax=Trypanosoma congolense (strain IL3000) TaxID=1068625 RepID=G0UP22_TRYCI|nr:conserved hypothetical protein [Trypanosoma congolense IL3000]
MRLANILRRVASGQFSSAQPPGRPYLRVVKMLQTDGEGPPAAWAVFEEFRAYYRKISCSAPTSEMPMQPLQQFCGSVGDVELFTVLMMKVLCDLHKLEDLRFLFAQCMLELPSPSVELFNVYLLAISLSDTFNQYEIENAVEAMRERGVEPDIVTRISLFIFYMRLGEDYTAWWPSIREEVENIARSRQDWRQKHPLLSMRLQHCFQTLLRVHHDVVMIHECFQLLKLIDCPKITCRLLLPYLLLSTNNAASPPSTAVELIEAMEEARKREAPAASGGATADTDASGGGGGHGVMETPPLGEHGEPVLNNDVTVLKLMAKCAKWGDVSSADYVLKYLQRHPGIILPEHECILKLLRLEALARSGSLREALFLVEDELPASSCAPGPRPKLFVNSKRLTLLNADPVMSLVHFIAEVDTRVEESLLILEERKEGKLSVSHKSLNILLEACALLRDGVKASLVFSSFRAFSACKTARTYSLLLRASPNAVQAVGEISTYLADMTDMGVEVTPDFLRCGLELALEAQDVCAAMKMIEYHERNGVTIESKLSARLLKMLCLVVDIESTRKVLSVLRATQSPVDPRCLSLCVATFKRWDIPCDDLRKSN